MFPELTVSLHVTHFGLDAVNILCNKIEAAFAEE